MLSHLLTGLFILSGILVTVEGKPRFKDGKYRTKLFRDDWNFDDDNSPPPFNDLADNKEWKNWKDDNLDIDLGEEKVKDLMTDVKDKEKKEKDISKFEDPCKNVFCHYGRVCEVTAAENKGKCVCAPDNFCASHSKKVCGTDGVWYPSHCELHRMACVKGIHIGINRKPQACHKASQIADEKKDAKETILNIRNVKLIKDDKKEPVKAEKIEITTIHIDDVETEKIKEEAKKEEEKKEELGTDTYATVTPPCTDLEFARLKQNLLMYHCARIGDNCNKEPARKQFLANIMFSYYDHDNSLMLDEAELSAVEHKDHLEKLSLYCSLTDLLTYDDKEEDGNISLSEFYRAFGIPKVLLDASLRSFSTAVVVGNSVELKCDIKGATDLTWKRNGGLLDDITTDDIKVFEDGSLYINNLGLHHTGNYTCQDKFVDDVVQTHTLNVHMPPIVKVSPGTQFHTTGSGVTLHCHVDGVPEPEIVWEMNEAPLQEIDMEGMMEEMDTAEKHYVMLHNNATLEIKTATYTKDTGAYKCKGKNSAGTAQDIATVFIENTKVPKYSEGSDQSEAFLVFHDKGYTMYEPSHCHVQHAIPGSFAAFKYVPEFAGDVLLSLCSEEKGAVCSWGQAVNVRNAFIYITQPKLHRVIVIELRDRANPVEIIPTDKVPVSVEYVAHLDQVWVLCWNGEESTGGKTLVVIRQASEDMQHHTVHTQPIGNRFDLVDDMYLPPNNDLHQHLMYGYVTHAGQNVLYKLDLHAMKYVKTIDLSDFDCQPQGVAFIPLGGQVMVHCVTPVSSPRPRRSSRLLLDYVTDKVLEYTDLGGEPHISPDARFMVVINNDDNTLAVYRVHDNGKLEHLFDEYINLHVSDVTFFPSERGRSYDFYASSQDKNDVLFINLQSGKVEMIEGVGPAMSPSEWPWSRKNRVLVSGGPFGSFLMTPAKDAVVVLDGRRRHVQCEWQDVPHANVIVWAQPRQEAKDNEY